MDELQPLLGFLPAKFAIYGTYWLAAEKALKLIQPVIASRFEAAIDRAVSSEEPEDEELLRRLFSNKAYRLAAFGLDFLIRFKLPGNAELTAALAKRKDANGNSTPRQNP